MKKTKKTFLVNEEDLEIINYNKNNQEISDFSEPEDLLQGESILNAANKVLDFNQLKEQQEYAIKYYNKFNENKIKAKKEQLFEIIKVPKKKKNQADKAAQIAAKKYLKSTTTLDFDDGRQ